MGRTSATQGLKGFKSILIGFKYTVVTLFGLTAHRT